MKMRRAMQIATVFAGIGGGVSLRRFQKRIEYHTDEDEHFTVDTDDGWVRDAYRYLPRGPRRGRPVVLVAGFGQNTALFDLGRGVSLARALADQGFEAVTVNLRGRGPRHNAKGSWTFDDLVTFDAPAIVSRVCDMTDTDSVTWLGVELGGQVLYASVLDGRTPGVAAAISIAAPAGYPRDAVLPGVTVPPRHRSHGRITLRAAVRHRGPALALARSQHRLEAGLRSATTDPVTAARYLTHAVSDESSALGDQLARWVATDLMTDAAGTRSWSDRLDRFRLPILMIAGAADRRTPLAAVERTYAGLGSTDRTLFVAGRDQGCGIDYSHHDLVFGRTAPADVWPVIVAWLRDHS